MIPSKFKIGGQEYTVEMVDELEDNYGEFEYVPPVIRLSRKSNGKTISDRQIEATFWHELFHAFQYMYNCEVDEAQAQCFSNFMMEFLDTRQ